MEKELQTQFDRVHESIDKLATMVANGFSAIDKRFNNVETDIAELRVELREEIRSIRTELERIPDDIDETYAKTLNDLLDRVTTIEKRLGIVG